jgi:predicted ATP-grasp superfamily ATP-dependent carboligase
VTLTAITDAACAKTARPEVYDVLVLDAAYKQSLVSVRSLGRAGLRVAAGECPAECDMSRPVLAFRSRYCTGRAELPSYATDADAFARAVVDFVREHAVRMVLPNGDGSIASLIPRREELAALGCVLALAPNAALEIANSKDRTLEIASKLGIAQPRTMRIDSVADLPAVFAEFGFPFVLKPTVSWTGRSDRRLIPVDVVNEAEAVDMTGQLLAAGPGLLAQEWACGRREGVTLFIAGDEVLASCGHVAYRTSPPLGGASVMRESIPVPEDIYTASVCLAMAVGIQGVCEVEFRRDASNRALLMEINARLAGTIYNAVHSGVDFPLMIWQRAAGLPIDRSKGYRTGVRTRWLHGDLRWLKENQNRAGRADSVKQGRALWTFASEFTRTRHYDCFYWRDLGPFLAEMRATAAAVRKSRDQQPSAKEPHREGAVRVHQ